MMTITRPLNKSIESTRVRTALKGSVDSPSVLCALTSTGRASAVGPAVVINKPHINIRLLPEPGGCLLRRHFLVVRQSTFDCILPLRCIKVDFPDLDKRVASWVWILLLR